MGCVMTLKLCLRHLLRAGYGLTNSLVLMTYQSTKKNIRWSLTVFFHLFSFMVKMFRTSISHSFGNFICFFSTSFSVSYSNENGITKVIYYHVYSQAIGLVGVYALVSSAELRVLNGK